MRETERTLLKRCLKKDVEQKQKLKEKLTVKTIFGPKKLNEWRR